MKRSNITTSILLILIGLGLILGCGRLTSLRRTSENVNSSPSTGQADNSNIASETPTPVEISGTPLYNRETLKDQGDTLGRIKASVKTDTNRKLTGKVAIIAKRYDFSDTYDLDLFSSAYPDHINTHDLEKYSISKEQVALTMEELDTLVRITCITKKLGTYTLTNGGQLPAKGLDCTVEMIDYPMQTIFAKRSFKPGKLREFVDVSSTDKEVMNYDGLHAAEDYIKSFPRE